MLTLKESATPNETYNPVFSFQAHIFKKWDCAVHTVFKLLFLSNTCYLPFSM